MPDREHSSVKHSSGLPHVLFQIEDRDTYIQQIVTMAITQSDTQ